MGFVTLYYDFVLPTDAHLKKIRHKAIVSDLENGSFWVLVDGNNSLKWKTNQCITPPLQVKLKAQILQHEKALVSRGGGDRDRFT